MTTFQLRPLSTSRSANKLHLNFKVLRSTKRSKEGGGVGKVETSQHTPDDDLRPQCELVAEESENKGNAEENLGVFQKKHLEKLK